MYFRKSHICSNKLDVQETNISFSQFTESEIISLDTGLRLDGLPALELWDLIVSVLGNASRVSDNPGRPVIDAHKRQKSQSRIDVIKDIDLVPSNVQSAYHEAYCMCLKTMKAVIKMIIKRQKSNDETGFPDPQSCS